MKPHYIPDNHGITTRIFIPIQEWNSLKAEHTEIERQRTYEIPQWHKDLVLERMEAFKRGTEELIDFEEAMDEIEKNL
ncbi:addiction module protein [Dyadobacter sp. CY343]|uniref:addiction module protein n=1 Tax=Dyadobacter sp. CY343 TaxID=2907299 RepID=UPI001F4852D5|nr:addiction module protein [Dyadobacter sp. CY343]MCE7063410.1 addiction module protein [Dyadobacter sp. CY343]